MAVEIFILSGARQGERLVLEGKEFGVGSDPDCEVFFDVQRDSSIRGRSAQFRLQEDGWHIHSAGSEVLVNQCPVTGWTRIRSGDVVRMSEAGPDFSFGIVAGATASSSSKSPADRLAASASSSKGAPKTIFESASMPESAKAERAIIDPAPTRGPVADVEPSVAPAPTARASLDRRWMLLAGGGLVLCIVALLVVLLVRSPPTIVVNVGQPGVSQVPQGGAVAGVDGKGNAPAEKVSDVRKQEKKSPARDIRALLETAVFLLQVEKAERCWPFATCVAISNDTLLTTAREAAQLAKWREEAGFKLWATRPADKFKVEVQDIRLHGMFVSLAETPNEQICFNIALVTVRGRLPTVAAVASAEELAKLVEGAPVACFGFTHEAEKINPSDIFEPCLTQGKVFVIPISKDLSGPPKLLDVKAEIPQNAYGSPVVNADGRILGVYSEAAGPLPGADATAGSGGLKNHHYVTLVNPEMINLALRDHSAKAWLPAHGINPKPSTNP